MCTTGIHDYHVGRHSINYALDVSLPPLADTEDSEFLHHQPYILRGLRDPTTLTKAPGPSGAKVILKLLMCTCYSYFFLLYSSSDLSIQAPISQLLYLKSVVTFLE